MIGAATVLASAMAAVTIPADVNRRLVSTYPTWAVRDGRSSGTVMEAVVEPDGTVRECRIVAFVGSERLANEECASLARRKLRPATDPDGQPILGLYRTYISRFVSGRSAQAESAAVRSWVYPADVTIHVAQPAGGKDLTRVVQVAVLVKADGVVASCERMAEGSEDVPQAVMDAACAEARKLAAAPMTTASGLPTDYVANVLVRLETDAPPA